MTDQTETARDRQRTQLLEAMSAVSEDRTCCGWASDWARTLHAEGGVWETLGRAVGWPTGNYDQWVWVSWDEAARLYGHEPAVPAGQAPDTDRAGLRERVAAAIYEHMHPGSHWSDTSMPAAWRPDYLAEADAVLAVLPAPADRAAGIRDAIAEIERDPQGVLPRLRHLADEAQPTEAVPCMRSEPHPAHSHSGLRKGVAVHGRCPGGEPAAGAQQPKEAQL